MADRTEIRNGRLRVASIDTTERDSKTPIIGEIIYNTDLITFEGYDGTNWGGIGGSYMTQEVDDETVDLSTDYLGKNLFICDTTSTNITFSLPEATASTKNRTYTFKNIEENGVIIEAYSGDDIDGASSKIISVQYDSITMVSNGEGSWFLV